MTRDIIYRKGTCFTFHDTVFFSEINAKIKETDNFYNKTMFKEALRTGFFEMQSARDKYRELSAKKNMHSFMITFFIEMQAILMAPICPHVAEHVWSILGKVSLKIIFLKIFKIFVKYVY